MIFSTPASEDRLGCVALPLLSRDVGANLENVFKLWDDPRFQPRVRADAPLPFLLVVVNKADAETLARAEALFKACPRMAACFAGFAAESADLEGDRDLYARHAAEPKGLFGNKAGPNFLFQRTMEIAARFGGWTLQIEIDCLPVQAGWLEDAQAVIDGGARAWVIGSIYGGGAGLERSLQTHLNGNALYKTGDPAFQTFLDEVWMPSLLARVIRQPNLAYDCWWAEERNRADARSGNAAWHLYQTYDSFFRNDPFIVNLLAGTDEARDFIPPFDRFAALGRTPVFFHGAAMNTILPKLLEDREASMLEMIDRLSPAGSGSAGTPAGAARPLRRGDSLPEARVETPSLRSARPEAASPAQVLLAGLAAELLLSPLETLALLQADAALAASVETARAQVGGGLAEHFGRVYDHALAVKARAA